MSEEVPSDPPPREPDSGSIFFNHDIGSSVFNSGGSGGDSTGADEELDCEECGSVEHNTDKCPFIYEEETCTECGDVGHVADGCPRK